MNTPVTPATLNPAPGDGSKGEKLAQRLSHILALLHQGDAINKRRLAQQFNVDVRTIDRDLGERLRGIAERTSDGWQLSQSARSHIPANHLHHYAQLAGTQYLFPNASLRYLLGQLETPSTQRATKVQPMAHESLDPQHSAMFDQLQHAVEQRHECHFTYKAKPRHAQPYRLLHRNGVWYLSAEEGGVLKNFSIALIQELRVDDSTRFTPDPAHNAYINAKDDVWFTTKTTEVLLRVAPEVAHYFSRRPLLPRQHHRTDDDGSLLVTTHINHAQQLLPVVRYWLPHVRIVQPQALHDELLQGLRAAVALWDTPSSPVPSLKED